MLFQRRDDLSIFEKLKVWIWPKKGLMRAYKYIAYRLGRLPASAYAIAAGIASGVAVSMTPFVGLHLFFAIAVAWLLRANQISAILASAVGNPFTFPFIWVACYKIGQLILPAQTLGLSDAAEPNFSEMFSQLTSLAVQWDLQLFMDRIYPIWFPMMIGSIPLTIGSGIVTYFISYRLIHGYQRLRRLKLLRIFRRERFEG